MSSKQKRKAVSNSRAIKTAEPYQRTHGHWRIVIGRKKMSREHPDKPQTKKKECDRMIAESDAEETWAVCEIHRGKA